MDPTVRERINTFLAQYDTLAIATVDEGQPYVTRVFFVEEPIEDSSLRLYGTFITTSRKLANLRQNPNIGIFIGPDQPTMWLEATAWARILTDEGAVNRVRTELARKSAVAAGFLAQVPIAAVELQVNWLRITNLTGQPMQTEVNFTTANPGKEEHA
jgi:general stress protein 26